MNHSEALELSKAKTEAKVTKYQLNLTEMRARALELEIASLKEDLEREIAFNEKLTTRLLETRRA